MENVEISEVEFVFIIKIHTHTNIKFPLTNRDIVIKTFIWMFLKLMMMSLMDFFFVLHNFIYDVQKEDLFLYARWSEVLLFVFMLPMQHFIVVSIYSSRCLYCFISISSWSCYFSSPETSKASQKRKITNRK